MKKKQIWILIGTLVLVAAIVLLILFLPRGKSAELYGKVLSVELDGKTYYGTPSGVCEGGHGEIYVADSALNVIWKVTEHDAEIVAGTLGAPTLSASFDGAYRDGDALDAAFNTPTDLTLYNGCLIISDTGNHVLRLYDPETEVVVTFAGNGEAKSADGELENASFISPAGLCLDDADNLYVADPGAQNVRLIDTYGYVSTFLGENHGFLDGGFEVAAIESVTDLAYEDGVLYLLDAGNYALRKVESGSLVTLAGTGNSLNADGDALSAGFVNPTFLCIRNGISYVSDTGAGAIKKLSDNTLSTILASDGASSLTQSPRGILCASDGKLYCADANAHCVLRVER